MLWRSITGILSLGVIRFKRLQITSALSSCGHFLCTLHRKCPPLFSLNGVLERTLKDVLQIIEINTVRIQYLYSVYIIVLQHVQGFVAPLRVLWDFSTAMDNMLWLKVLFHCCFSNIADGCIQTVNCAAFKTASLSPVSVAPQCWHRRLTHLVKKWNLTQLFCNVLQHHCHTMSNISNKNGFNGIGKRNGFALRGKVNLHGVFQQVLQIKQ